MPNYWVAGANVDKQDMTDHFIDHGFWFADAQGVQDLIETIQPRDRIAIKRMLGQGATEIAIKALGVVQKAEYYEALRFKMVYVDWIGLTEDRRVPFGGFGAALHGPFPGRDDRMREIFWL